MSISDLAPSAAGSVRRASFTGNAREYFGIWIVNVLLTIVTLGIYSAWAKVRRNRYFYGNTVIADRAFDYHATGKQIFIGRLIVVGFFLVTNILSTIFPPFALIVFVLILVALPWLIQRSLRFSARVTSYRNVRFNFTGSVGGAFVSILLGSMVASLSFGILAPLSSRWVWRYVFNNLHYGDRPFATDPKIGALYRVWILPAVLIVFGTVLVAGLGAMIASAASTMTETEMVDGMAGFSVFHWAILFVFLAYGLAGLLYRIGVRNVVFNATTLDGRHRLVSDAPRFQYAWIAISNVIVTVLTLSLMRPWAAVRMARFMAIHTGVIVVGDLGEVLSSMEASGSAVSAEYLDLEGFDFGF
ncbi:YjgN family protein [Neorhizobium sp. NPDC001467]|uniref:YjgN family protein n=1 Tax=Neorhizobium sp. NPDC001467 TaxID=3390595 RepID=UPI003D074F59